MNGDRTGCLESIDRTQQIQLSDGKPEPARQAGRQGRQTHRQADSTRCPAAPAQSDRLGATATAHARSSLGSGVSAVAKLGHYQRA